MSWLGYAFRFMQFPLGLFGVAIASATLPSISRSAAAGAWTSFGARCRVRWAWCFCSLCPLLGLVVLGKVHDRRVYQGGQFQLYDTQQTAVALSCYAMGLAGYAALKVLAPPSTRWTTRGRRCW